MIKDNIKETDIEGEKIYLRKDFLGWRVVSPIKDKEGCVNYVNLFFGSKRFALFTIVWLLIMALIFFGVNEMLSSCKDMANDPCKYFNVDCSIVRNSFDAINNIPIIQGGDK